MHHLPVRCLLFMQQTLLSQAISVAPRGGFVQVKDTEGVSLKYSCLAKENMIKDENKRAITLAVVEIAL